MGLIDSLATAFGSPTSVGGGASNSAMPTPDTLANYGKVNGLIGTLDSLVKAAETSQGASGRMAPLGLDAIIQDWVRQQFIYRRSILQDLYVLAYQVTEVRSVVLAILREVFRKGFGPWQQQFMRKCAQCGKEFDDDEDEHCDTCFVYELVEQEIYDKEYDEIILKNVRKFKRDENNNKIPVHTYVPDYAQQKGFDELKSNANSFHQTMLDVLHEFMTDILIADDGFLLLNKEYEIDSITGKISKQKIFEITRLHPALTEYDIDRKDGLPERSHFLCPVHREQQTHTAPGNCDVVVPEGFRCNAKLLPAMFRYYWRGRYRYYLADEICHASFFNPSKTYGYSPVLTVFEKVLALVGADRTLYRYWYERRIPPGLIITYTDDPESLEQEIERVKTQMLNDPNTFPWIAASAKNNRGKTDFVKLAYTFQELDYLPVRQEIRDRVAMLWGVTPLFTGDASSVGGLTRESAQTTMHDNLIESYQNVINHQVLPHLLKQMNIGDWEIGLIPPKETTEETELGVEKMRIDNAVQMMQLGYEPIKEKGKAIKFKFKKAEQQQPGMMPGAPGQPPTPGMPDAPPNGGMPPPPGGAPPSPAGAGGGGLPADVDQLPPPPPIAGPEATEGGDVPKDAEEINPNIAQEELDEEEANESGDL